jgi:hypothetical protein
LVEAMRLQEIKAERVTELETVEGRRHTIAPPKTEDGVR